jgi:hypothetical protein
MSFDRHTKEILFEAKQEHAGEVVGWTHAEVNSDTELTRVVAGFARIGNEGAEYSYLSGEQDNILTHEGSVRGFVGATAVSVCGRRDEIAEIRVLESPILLEQKGTFLAYGFPGERPAKGEGVWAMGEAALIQTIKDELARVDADFFYPAVYYNLAVLTDEPIAEYAMNSQTQKILTRAYGQVQGLDTIKNIDATMKHDLTIFGAVPADEVPEAFAESRRKVSAIERELLTDLPAYAHRWFASLAEVRTWPYMDPLAADERVAFGNELSALREHSIGPADYELRREIVAAEARLKQAHRLIQSLSRLVEREMGI